MITKDYSQRNFTLKAIILSILLAMLLAASNAYLILKIGMTISASIPAAVLSIGIFRLFKHYSVFECNLVQTAASAGEGIAAAVAFVLPAMIILHFWMHFDYWITTLIVSLGGLLGVFLSIPLRRVLLGLPDLKYPEGTAIGNVLKVSTQSKGLLNHLLKGIGAGGFITLLQQGLQVIGNTLPLWWKGRVLFGITMGFNPAAFAVGFIIGPEVCMSLFIGMVIGWLILIPLLSIYYGIPQADSAYDSVMTLWSHHLRYVGVGTMLVGSFWTLIKLIKPITQGVKVSFSLLGKRHLIAEHDRDVPMLGIGLGVLIFSALIFGLVTFILTHLNLNLTLDFIIKAAVLTLLFLMVVGFLMATVCGYIVGVVGSSNSPLSSMVIITILLLGLSYLGLFNTSAGSASVMQVVAFTLLMAAIMSAIATIANENMQDLKAGQMIGATPWKQQIMLAIGVLAASLVIAPVFELLFNAYGIGGVFPRAGMDPAQVLSAPQATLMSAIATGVFTHQLDWYPIVLGAVIAVVAILVDEFIFRRYCKIHLIVLAIGFSIYLPVELTTAMILGGFLHFWLKHQMTKRHASKEAANEIVETANLRACGIVAGSSLMGVFLAIPFIIAGSANVLTPTFATNPHLSWVLNILGLISLLWLMKLLFLKSKN